MRGPDIAVIVCYFLTMIAVGVAYSRHMRSAEMYFAGGKQLPWWLGGVSFVMSYLSALSIIVYAGLGYQYGMVALTLYWSTVPASLIATWLFARRWRRAGIITPTQFLEERFSPAIRQLFVWSGVPLKIIDESLKVVAIGIFVSAGLGISATTSMVAIGITILIYSVAGGLWAVVVTDFVQFVLVTGGILLLLPLSYRAAGGWEHFVHSAPPGFFHPVHSPYAWSYVIAFLVLSCLSLSGNWSLIQKFYSARSDREAVQMGWLAAVLFLLLPPVWILTGMLARAFVSPSGFDPQSIYARLAVEILPYGMLGLMVAALFAATMSVLSSGYNVMSAVLTLDVYQRWIRPHAEQKEIVFVGRILTAGIGIVVLLIALAVSYYHWSIFNTMVAAFGFLLPPTVLPLLAGLLSRRLSSAGALAGFVAGLLIGGAMLAYGLLTHPPDAGAFQAASILVPAACTSLVLWGFAAWLPAKGEERDRAMRFIVGLNEPSRESEDTVASPAPIAGVVIGIMGSVLVIVGVLPLVFGRGISGITLGMGTLFVIIGIGMISTRWLGPWRARGKLEI
ncbi:MAG TPA: sodium/solute symporter [Bryocella sp.]|nr:sodium/solute symporter [Bryocella sp.]